MEVLQEKIGAVTVVSLNGRLDTTNYNDVEDKLNEVVDQNEGNLVVDCGKLDYISSSGLRVLLVAFKKATSTSGIFVLCALQDSIKEIFDISGFSSIFEITNTRDEALAKF